MSFGSSLVYAPVMQCPVASFVSTTELVMSRVQFVALSEVVR